MKVTDLNEVAAEVRTQLENEGSLLLDYVSKEVAVSMTTNIYVMSDQTKGFGQDIPDTISVISSQTRISTIFEGHSSFYKESGAICEYNDLSEDVSQIILVLDTAIQRTRNNTL